jgi:hypothetical protein
MDFTKRIYIISLYLSVNTDEYTKGITLRKEGIKTKLKSMITYHYTNEITDDINTISKIYS